MPTLDIAPRPLRSLACGDARRHRNPDPVVQAESDRAWIALARDRIRQNQAIASEARRMLDDLEQAERALAPLAARFGPPPANPDRPPAAIDRPRPPKRRRAGRQPLLIIRRVRLPRTIQHARVEPPETPGGFWVVWFAAGPRTYAEAHPAIRAAQNQHAGTRNRLEAVIEAAIAATDGMVDAIRKVEARLTWLSE